MKYLICILFFVSLSTAALLHRDSSSEVVKDHTTHLMWADNSSSVSLQLTHKEAIEYCEKLSHAGYTNWRLPKIEEFETIVDKLNRKTYINKAFKYNVPTGYWAYKAHFRTFWYYADYMNFISGTAYFDNRNVNKYVRCVRDIK
ncbi:MAG: DUF1566 domain-containing protein [Arcobacteraceae bacterium]